MTVVATRSSLTIVLSLLALAAGAVMAAPAWAAPGQPNFSPAIYAGGEAFGTKGTADLPPPNGANAHSFQLLIGIANGAEGQLAVAEAGPGDPGFNGGRWERHEAAWTDEFLAMGDAPLLTSYQEVVSHVEQGHLVIAAEVTRYFQCPLLPTK